MATKKSLNNCDVTRMFENKKKVNEKSLNKLNTPKNKIVAHRCPVPNPPLTPKYFSEIYTSQNWSPSGNGNAGSRKG